MSQLKSELEKISDVDSIIDVGVMEGTFNLYNSFPDANLYLIDPLVESHKLTQQQLVTRDYEFFNCALGNSEGSTTINIRTNMRESSILEREVEKANITEQRKVQIKKLDSLLPKMKLGKTLLKIDTEGYELNVLRGAKETIKKCNYIICETNVRKRFKGSYRFEDMILFMLENQFTLKAILNAPKALNCIDILFERKNKIQ